MGVFQMSVVLGVVLGVAAVCNGVPSDPGYWGIWENLQQDHKEAQEQQKQAQPQIQGSRLWSGYQQQQKQELEAEMEEERQGAVQKMLEEMHLEDVAIQLGADILGTLMPQGLGQGGPGMPGPGMAGGPAEPQCVNKIVNVTVLEMLQMGQIVYTVCGHMDAAALHLRYQTHGETTPSMDTTTPTPTTTTTPFFPLCPEFTTTPSAPTSPPQTTAQAEETTTKNPTTTTPTPTTTAP